MKMKAPTLKSAVLIGLLATTIARPTTWQQRSNTTIASSDEKIRRAFIDPAALTGDLGADGRAAGEAAGADAAGAGASGSAGASSGASDAHLGASDSTGATGGTNTGASGASDAHIGANPPADTTGNSGSDLEMTDADLELDGSDDASTPDAGATGLELESEADAAVAGHTAANDHGYAAKLAANYHEDSSNGPFDKPVTDSTEAWLPQKVPGFDSRFQDPSMVKYTVWTNRIADADKTDGNSVFQMFAQPSTGTMYLTRMYRTGQISDTLYPDTATLATADRIPMSEHIYQGWSKVGGGQTLKHVIAANVVNKQTVNFLETLEDSAVSTRVDDVDQEGDHIFSYEGSKTLPDAGTNDPVWNDLLGSVGASSVLKSIGDHPGDAVWESERILSMDWKFSGEAGEYNFDDGIFLQDNFIIAHLG
jgi:hypothetical protein